MGGNCNDNEATTCHGMKMRKQPRLPNAVGNGNPASIQQIVLGNKGSCSRRSLNGSNITHACDLKCDISNRKCPSIPPGSRQALNESVNH